VTIGQTPSVGGRSTTIALKKPEISMPSGYWVQVV